MSTLKTNRVQLGQSGTATNNFTITAENADGTIKLARGNAGATTADILSIDSSNNINIPGTAKRITGDFSNATVANRVLFQTSTSNSNTVIGLVPNGTVSSGFAVSTLRFEDSTSVSTGNGSAATVGLIQSTELRISSFGWGTGSALPITFYTGGSERLRIDTSGNLGLGVTPSAWSAASRALTVKSTGSAIEGSLCNSGVDNSTTVANNAYYNAGWKYVWSGGSFGATRYDLENGQHRWYTAPSGTAGNTITFTQVAIIDASGNFLITSPAGLGYGTGSGGTVTQATSKATSVTLNKPTGTITTFNDALAANTRITFKVFNSLVNVADIVIANYVDDFGNRYRVDVQSVWTGYFEIGLTNVDTVSRSESVRITFAIIKGATA